MTLTKVWAVTRFTLLEAVRSGAVLLELLSTLAFSLLMFLQPLDLSSAVSLIGPYVAAAAAVTTALTLRRAASPRGYLMLAHLSRRASYLYGRLLAAALMTVGVYVALMVIGVWLGRIQDPRPDRLLAATIGILANALLVLALAACGAPLVWPRLGRHALLAVVIIATVAVTVAGSITAAAGLLRALLLPPLSVFRYAVVGQGDAWTLAALAVTVVYAALLLLTAGWAFERRDLALS